MDEGEGIVNDDEYEKAIQRLEKINKKITTLVKNWNEESKLAKNSNEIAEIEEFYRPYMDQYNNRWKALERLMEMYDEYCTSAAPTGTPQQRHKMKQQVSPSTSQTQQAPSQETIPKDVPNRRDQINQDLEVEKTSLKEGIDRRPSTSTSSTTLGMDTMSSTLPITTRPSVFPNIFAGTTTEGIGNGRTLSQGRISTLSSMIRPMPTTTTRTIAITREESQQDALETVRQLIGSTAHTAILPVPITSTATQEPRLNDNDDINTSNTEVGPRFLSSHLDSRMTDMTTPIGMATPIAPDLVWPGHPGPPGGTIQPPYIHRNQLPPQVVLDTSGLEKTFLGMTGAVKKLAQQQLRSNYSLNESVNQQRKEREEGRQVLLDIAHTSHQNSFQHILATIPYFDGTGGDVISWLERTEAACLYAKRGPRQEALGHGGDKVLDSILSVPSHQPWKILKETLIRDYLEFKSPAHTCTYLENMTQGDDESLCLYVYRYTRAHRMVTGLAPKENMDPSRWTHFLASINNTAITDKVLQSKTLPRNLDEAMSRAIQKEAGFQLSEGVNMA